MFFQSVNEEKNVTQPKRADGLRISLYLIPPQSGNETNSLCNLHLIEKTPLIIMFIILCNQIYFCRSIFTKHINKNDHRYGHKGIQQKKLTTLDIL